jgi:hypothetical protein
MSTRIQNWVWITLFAVQGVQAASARCPASDNCYIPLTVDGESFQLMDFPTPLDPIEPLTLNGKDDVKLKQLYRRNLDVTAWTTDEKTSVLKRLAAARSSLSIRTKGRGGLNLSNGDWVIDNEGLIAPFARTWKEPVEKIDHIEVSDLAGVTEAWMNSSAERIKKAAVDPPAFAGHYFSLKSNGITEKLVIALFKKLAKDGRVVKLSYNPLFPELILGPNAIISAKIIKVSWHLVKGNLVEFKGEPGERVPNGPSRLPLKAFSAIKLL